MSAGCSKHTAKVCKKTAGCHWASSVLGGRKWCRPLRDAEEEAAAPPAVEPESSSAAAAEAVGCGKLKTAKRCAKDAGCFWTGPYCSGPNERCAKLEPRSRCLRTKSCKWTEGVCHKKVVAASPRDSESAAETSTTSHSRFSRGAMLGGDEEAASSHLQPKIGDRILIIKPKYLQMIFSGEKNVEIRGVRYKPGIFFVGYNSMIYGYIRTGEAVRIENLAEFNAMLPRHHWNAPSMPYKNTWAIPILHVEEFQHPIPFYHAKGAIGIVRYRKSANDILSDEAKPTQRDDADSELDNSLHDSNREKPAVEAVGCGKLKTAKRCTKDAGCLWTGPYCSGPNERCAKLAPRSRCLRTKNCKWTEGVCHKKVAAASPKDNDTSESDSDHSDSDSDSDRSSLSSLVEVPRPNNVLELPDSDLSEEEEPEEDIASSTIHKDNNTSEISAPHTSRIEGAEDALEIVPFVEKDAKRKSQTTIEEPPMASRNQRSPIRSSSSPARAAWSFVDESPSSDDFDYDPFASDTEPPSSTTKSPSSDDLDYDLDYDPFAMDQSSPSSADQNVPIIPVDYNESLLGGVVQKPDDPRRTEQSRSTSPMRRRSSKQQPPADQNVPIIPVEFRPITNEILKDYNELLLGGVVKKPADPRRTKQSRRTPSPMRRRSSTFETPPWLHSRTRRRPHPLDL